MLISESKVAREWQRLLGHDLSLSTISHRHGGWAEYGWASDLKDSIQLTLHCRILLVVAPLTP